MKHIQILGVGCPKCKKLTENADAAAKALNIDYKLEKITDLNAIADMGVMMTPGLVIDGELKSSGAILSAEDIQALLLGNENEDADHD